MRLTGTRWPHVSDARRHFVGGKGGDLLLGGARDDVLTGEPSDEVLIGEPGDDTIDGGPRDKVTLETLGANTVTAATPGEHSLTTHGRTATGKTVPDIDGKKRMLPWARAELARAVIST
jgi:hypothetical protein